MKTCRNCGRENPDDRDFCECGEYLRWEATRAIPAVQPPTSTPESPAPAPGPPGSTPEPPPPGDDVPPGREPPGGDREPATPAPQAPARHADTAVQPSPRAQRTPPEAQALPSDAVALTLRLPDADVSTGEPVEARVAAGGQVSVIALIRNQSGIVDNYDLSVIGLPEGWSTVAPPTVYLVPFGSRGTYEQEVHVQLHPPRSPDAEARAWAFEVSASSRAADAEVASAAATLVVEPYQEIQLELRPERAGGRRKARFAVGVRNCANAPTEVDLGAIDTEEACGFQFDTPPEAAGAASRSGAGGALELGQRGERSARQAARLGNKAEALSQGGVDVGAKAKALARGRISSGGGFSALSGADGGGQNAPGHARLVVEAGERVETALTVLPPKPILVGRPLDRRIQVSAGPAAADAPPLVREATFRQRPWLPWWLPLALLLAVLLGLLVWMLLPKTATVPKVTGQKTVFSAGRVLKKEELKLGTVTPERRKGARPGAIVEQDPRAGEEADEGSAVDLVTVLGSKVRKVPKVVGLGLPDAEEKLVDRKFQLKSVRPEPDDPNKAKVVKQVPKAGARAREGTAVSLFVEAPKAPGQGGGGGGAGGAGKPGGGASSGGLAAGPRKVVYDNGEGRLSIVAARGGDGKPLANRAPKRFNFASQPVWDPEGKKIVYRTGKDDEGQAGIWVMDLSKGKPTAQALTNPGFDADTDDRRPAISPDGKVVAFVRGEKKRSDHDLCFVAIAGSAPPSCIPEPDQEVTRPTWAPDGKAILVVASDTEDKQYELLRYTSEQPGSPDASDWQDTGFETDELHSPEEGRHVVAVAWSPARDRRRVAFAADWTSPGDYGLFIGNASEDGKLEAEPKRRGEVSIACELSWSSNGKELAVVSKAGCGSEGSATISLFAVDDPRPSLEPLAEGRNPSLQPDKPAP